MPLEPRPLGNPHEEAILAIRRIIDLWRTEKRLHGETLYWPDSGLEYLFVTRRGPNQHSLRLEIRVTQHDQPAVTTGIDAETLCQAVKGRDLSIEHNKYVNLVVGTD